MVSIYLKASADYNGNNPNISIYKDGFLVVAAQACVTSTSYQQFSISYTPTVNGLIELVVDCAGTVGSIYADDVGFAGITQPLNTWSRGFPVFAQIASTGSGGGNLIDGGLVR